jgi:hypothetical protein
MQRIKYIIFALMFLLLGSLSGKHSDQYLLANYSYLRCYQNLPGFYYALLDSMQAANYNASVITMLPGDFPQRSDKLLKAMDQRGIDVLLYDMAFTEGSKNPEYGSEAFSIANYWRFEAEYDSTFKENILDDMYFYNNSLTTGVPVTDELASGKYLLRLNKGQAGFAFNKLEFRWQDKANTNYNIGNEFRFIQREMSDGSKGDIKDNPATDDTLYITLAFKCSDFPADPNTELMRFSFNGFDKNQVEHQVPHLNTLNSKSGMTSHLTAGEYTMLPLISKDEANNRVWQHKEIVLQVSVQDLYKAGLLDGSISWKYLLSNLNPQVYWNGKGILELDYVEFEDTMHKRQKTDTELIKAVRDRIQALAMRYDNIKYFYLTDEPTQGQFDSFRRIKKDIFPDIKTIAPNCSGFYTCSILHRKNVSKPNNMGYDHIGLYAKIVTPELIAFDIYPIKGWMQWNNPTEKRGVQRRLDYDMLSYYKYYKELCMKTGAQYMPCPQSHGEWNYTKGENGFWALLRPPKYMQKCLQLLPLCYGADGILTYKIYDRIKDPLTTKLTFQEFSTIDVSPSGELTMRPGWQGLQEANRKILAYAEDMEPREWLDADVILTTGYQNPEKLPAVHTKAIEVLPQKLVQNEVDLYDGYVQCGLFTAEGKYPYFMLVNRRTEYISMVNNPSRSDSLLNITPDKLDSYFVPAPPQSVKFTIDNSAKGIFGKDVALYDPFSKELFYSVAATPEISIDPGDGRLLQMCATLPKKVDGKTEMNHLAVLQGDITLEKKTEVTVKPDCKLIIKEGSKITLKKGAKLIILGETEIGDNVQIKLLKDSILNLNEASCKWGKNVKITGAK